MPSADLWISVLAPRGTACTAWCCHLLQCAGNRWWEDGYNKYSISQDGSWVTSQPKTYHFPLDSRKKEEIHSKYTTYPKVCGHQNKYVIVGQTVGINLPPLFWFQAFHMIREPDCGDLLPFSHKSLTEVSHWCRVTRPGSQFIPEVSDGGLRSGLCAGKSIANTPDCENHLFMDLALCTGTLSLRNGIFTNKH